MNAVSAMIEELPYSLREQIGGYVTAVAEAAPEIFREAGIAMDPNLRNEFLMAAGVRRLWGVVSGRYWLLDHSLQIVQKSAEGISVGSERLQRNKGSMRELAGLSNALETELRRLGLFELVQLRSLKEVLQLVREQRS